MGLFSRQKSTASSPSKDPIQPPPPETPKVRLIEFEETKEQIVEAKATIEKMKSTHDLEISDLTAQNEALKRELEQARLKNEDLLKSATSSNKQAVLTSSKKPAAKTHLSLKLTDCVFGKPFHYFFELTSAYSKDNTEVSESFTDRPTFKRVLSVEQQNQAPSIVTLSAYAFLNKTKSKLLGSCQLEINKDIVIPSVHLVREGKVYGKCTLECSFGKSPLSFSPSPILELSLKGQKSSGNREEGNEDLFSDLNASPGPIPGPKFDSLFASEYKAKQEALLDAQTEVKYLLLENEKIMHENDRLKKRLDALESPVTFLFDQPVNREDISSIFTIEEIFAKYELAIKEYKFLRRRFDEMEEKLESAEIDSLTVKDLDKKLKSLALECLSKDKEISVLQKTTKDIPMLLETVKTQESVIQKMEQVIKKNLNSWEMTENLKLENDRLLKSQSKAASAMAKRKQQQQSPAIEDTDKHLLEAELLRERVAALENQLIKSAKNTQIITFN
jgi:hypothetical protein